MSSIARPMPAAALLAVALVAAPGSRADAAGSYDFLAAPQIDLNRIFRLDKATGEVGACQYGLSEGTIGVTLCPKALRSALPCAILPAGAPVRRDRATMPSSRRGTRGKAGSGASTCAPAPCRSATC